jgi:hypothetical protein
MSASEDALYELKIDHGLLLRFLAGFSRFEYALKRAGFCTVSGGPQHQWVSPAWDDFAGNPDAITRFAVLRQEPAIAQALEYFKQQPPRRQILEGGGKLDFAPSTPPDITNLLQVTRCVRTIRNNLFHGGKYPSGPRAATARDEELIHCAVVVLEGILSCHEGVRISFFEHA